MKLRRAETEYEVELLEVSASVVRVAIDGEEISGELIPLADGSTLLLLAGRRCRIAGSRTARTIAAAGGPLSLQLQPVDQTRSTARGGLATPTVYAPMPGKVLKVLAAQDEAVAANQVLLVMEAMKMEIPLRAETAAVVKRIHVSAGQSVEHGAPLIDLAPAPPPV